MGDVVAAMTYRDLARLGDIFERDGVQWIVTSVYPNSHAIAARIPDGDTSDGLGRRWTAADVETIIIIINDNAHDVS